MTLRFIPVLSWTLFSSSQNLPLLFGKTLFTDVADYSTATRQLVDCTCWSQTEHVKNLSRWASLTVNIPVQRPRNETNSRRMRLGCGSTPCLLVSNPLASAAHSEGECTGHFGARITNCSCGDGYQGQQHTVGQTLVSPRCIDQAKDFVERKNTTAAVLFIIKCKKSN